MTLEWFPFSDLGKKEFFNKGPFEGGEIERGHVNISKIFQASTKINFQILPLFLMILQRDMKQMLAGWMKKHKT